MLQHAFTILPAVTSMLSGSYLDRRQACLQKSPQRPWYLRLRFSVQRLIICSPVKIFFSHMSMLIGPSIPIRVHTRWKSGEEEKWRRDSIRHQSAVCEPLLRLNNTLRSISHDI